MLFLRNNYTIIEPVWLSGEAEGASVSFLDSEGFEAAGGVVAPPGSKHRRLSLPRIAAGSIPDIPSLRQVCVWVCVYACVCSLLSAIPSDLTLPAIQKRDDGCHCTID